MATGQLAILVHSLTSRGHASHASPTNITNNLGKKREHATLCHPYRITRPGRSAR
jgi:hypothetical protein